MSQDIKRAPRAEQTALDPSVHRSLTRKPSNWPLSEAGNELVTLPFVSFIIESFYACEKLLYVS